MSQPKKTHLKASSDWRMRRAFAIHLMQAVMNLLSLQIADCNPDETILQKQLYTPNKTTSKILVL